MRRVKRDCVSVCASVGVHFWCPVLREGRCAESPHTGLSQRAFPEGETPSVSVVMLTSEVQVPLETGNNCVKGGTEGASPPRRLEMT